VHVSQSLDIDITRSINTPYGQVPS